VSGGFAADWLALREPVDARARADAVTARAAAWSRSRGALTIVEFGAGAGSNLRFLAPRLALPQRWRLIDHDPLLLAEAARRGVPSSLSSGVAVETVCADLAAIDLPATIAGHDLITASALFDLVSAAWCERLIAAVAAPGRALLAVLTYDGRMTWQPAAADDAFVTSLVNGHQRRVKGFGPALGPEAAHLLPAAARGSGAEVVTGTSDWQIGPAEAGMQAALLAMLAAAAKEQAPSAADRIDTWLAGRIAAIDSAHLTVGHVDMFAAW